MGVVAPLGGYVVVTRFVEDATAYMAVGCAQCAYCTLCGCADDGAEQTVGQGVEPGIHAYHAGVDYSGVAGVDVYALWGEFLSQVGGE